jgi:hypothetical protein
MLPGFSTWPRRHPTIRGRRRRGMSGRRFRAGAGILPCARKTAPTSPRTSGDSATRSPRPRAFGPASSERSCPSTTWWAASFQGRGPGREAGDACDLHFRQRLRLGGPRIRRRGVDGRGEARPLQRLHPGAVLPALARPCRRGRHRSAAGRERRHRADRALGRGRCRRSCQAASRRRSLLDSGRRGRMLLEYWKEPGRRIPTWASLRTRRFQYVEYCRHDGRRVWTRVLQSPPRPVAALQPARGPDPGQRPARRGPPGKAEAGWDRSCFGRQGLLEPLSLAWLAP